MSTPAAPALPRIRATVLCIWAVVVLMTPYGNYARLPEELGAGQGIGRLLLDVDWLRGVLWSGRTLTILKWTTVAACLGALVAGRRARWLMPLVVALVLTLDAVTKSLTGYANHAQVAPLVVLGLVTLFDDERAERAAVWLVRFALVVPYTFIGLHRLLEGGLALYLGDALPHYIAQNSAGYSYYGFTIGLRLSDGPIVLALLKAGFAIMTLFELLAVCALVWPRFSPVWVIVTAGFHLATLPLMNILFWENLLLLLVAFAPWRAGARRRRSRKRFGRRLPAL